MEKVWCNGWPTSTCSKIYQNLNNRQRFVSLVGPLVSSFICSFPHVFVRSYVHAFVDTFIILYIRPSIHSYSYIHTYLNIFINSFICHPPLDSLAYIFLYQFLHSAILSLANLFINSSICPSSTCIHTYINSFIGHLFIHSSLFSPTSSSTQQYIRG